MRLSVRVLVGVLGLVSAAGLWGLPVAEAQVAGQNVNMVSGTKWPTGDPFLQRQNEPSMAVSTRNPLHILSGANDYRSVDLEQVLSGGAETGDAWLGLFKSFDGGFTWQSNLLPGCPYAVSQCKDSGALSGRYQAAADPVVRAGTNGMFYYAGLAFDRATSSTTASSVSTIFVARYNDLNNNEQIDPITYIDTHIVATGNSAQFLDKPSMAVDIPRAGASTCSFTANEPGVGPNGGTLAVRQSFAAGNVYIAYTDFLTATKANSTPTHLMFTHSTDCGVTWSTPVQINTGTTTSQGSAIAVNPITGAVYVAWRQFASAGISNAILIAQSTNAGKSFSKPVQISTFQPFDQGTTGTSFRTNAYPALTTDMFGFVYVAFSARGVSSSGDARVVAAGSLDGTHWTPAIMVDNPSKNAQTNPSGRGHQIMPAITFANGRLTLLYYDLRLDHYAGTYTPNPASLGNYSEMLEPEGELGPPSPMPNEVFTPFIDDAGLTLRRHTLDLRVLELGIFPTITLGPSVLVSQYEFGCCVNPETEDIEQFKFNVPNLPLFDSGQEAFLGDYIDVVPSPMFVPSGNSWTYNFAPSVNPLFHATWTDNRDVVPPPPGGSWENYTAPVVAGALSVENGQPLPACVSGEEGMRNQNIYTAQITGGLVVGAPGNAKPLGTTTFNGKTVPFQRAFPVEAQNSTAQPINVRFTIASQPTGGTASFLQFSKLTTLDVTIPPYSSVSRSVFATSTSAAASITVNVVQITAIGGSVVNNGLSSSAVLNPDITNPNITNPNITNPNITNAEVTNPNITNPNITNPNITNPNITNPNITNTSYLNPNITNPNITNLDVTNVSATNPNITNPNITNPNITNPNITNPNITNPNITNPDITNGSIQDVTYPITNNGNTTASYTVKTATTVAPPGGIVLQLIINKLYQTPVAVNCQLGVQTHWVTVANIANPKLFTVADPNITNPDITNATPNEASVTLAPGETAFITIRVVNPTPALTPFNPLTGIIPVTVPQAVNTTTVLSNPGNTNLTAPPVYPPVTILTAALPATDRNDPGYSVQLQASGGKPGADTWSIIAGALPPGINLSASGLVSGTATTPGSFPFTIQAADSNSPSDVGVQNYTLNVSVTPLTEQFVLPPPDGVMGQPYSIASPLAVNGGTTPYTWTATGLPPGLSISASSGQIAGTPTVANPTGSTVTVTATDAATPPESVPFTTTIRVGSPIVISPATLPPGTIGAPYAFQLNATGGIGTLVFGPSSPAAGVLLDSNGALTIANPQASTISFSVTVHDQSNLGTAPGFQLVGANYTITFAGQVGSNITFTTQPTNSVAGQLIGSSPIVVHVQDNTGAAIAGANVILAFASQPCAAATLGGNNVVVTGADGNASFGNLTIDHGQNGFALLATVVNQTAASNAFNVSGFCATGNLNTARSNHVAVALPNSDVLVAGGTPSPSINATATAEIFTGSQFTLLTAPMNSARSSFTGTLLGNGSVLLAGGINAGGDSVNSVETYINGVFFADSNTMSVPRDSHTATLLPSGDVLIAGGENGAGNVLNTAEIYHVADGTFSAPITMSSAHVNHTATLFTRGPLQGKVLIVGGFVRPLDAIVPTTAAEIYDPVANTFTATGSLNVARADHVAVLLPNGKVLIAGGTNASSQAEASAELYDPVAQTFSLTGPLGFAESNPTATLLPNGQVLVFGGTGTAGQSNQAQMYNPGTGTFSTILGMVSTRADFPVVTLSDGTLLITGGFTAPSSLTNAEIYYPGTAPIQITTTTLPNAPTNAGSPPIPYSAQIQTLGGTGATTFSLTGGALPPTFSLSQATGVLSSAAVTDAAGTYNFTIQAASAGPPSSSASQSYTLTLVPFFVGITPNTLPSGTEGAAYSHSISSTGGVTPFSYQESGSLPPGISFNNGSPSASVSGTPGAAGTFVFNVQATDSSVPPQGYTEQLTLSILPQPPTTLAVQDTSQTSVALSWNASPAADVAGYNIHYGTTSGVYTTTVSAQNVTATSINGLAAGTTYFIVVDAVSTSGVESVFSNEVSATTTPQP
ncbi:MAG: kelch repeat-containing protein [Candidatus Acidiferrum sp.]